MHQHATEDTPDYEDGPKEGSMIIHSVRMSHPSILTTQESPIPVRDYADDTAALTSTRLNGSLLADASMPSHFLSQSMGSHAFSDDSFEPTPVKPIASPLRSVRSILKKPSKPELNEGIGLGSPCPQTPGRSVTFSASTQMPELSPEASSHATPLFCRQAPWDGKAQIIVDSPETSMKVQEAQDNLETSLRADEAYRAQAGTISLSSSLRASSPAEKPAPPLRHARSDSSLGQTKAGRSLSGLGIPLRPPGVQPRSRVTSTRPLSPMLGGQQWTSSLSFEDTHLLDVSAPLKLSATLMAEEDEDAVEEPPAEQTRSATDDPPLLASPADAESPPHTTPVDEFARWSPLQYRQRPASPSDRLNAPLPSTPSLGRGSAIAETPAADESSFQHFFTPYQPDDETDTGPSPAETNLESSPLALRSSRLPSHSPVPLLVNKLDPASLSSATNGLELVQKQVEARDASLSAASDLIANLRQALAAAERESASLSERLADVMEGEARWETEYRDESRVKAQYADAMAREAAQHDLERTLREQNRDLEIRLEHATAVSRTAMEESMRNTQRVGELQAQLQQLTNERRDEQLDYEARLADAQASRPVDGQTDETKRIVELEQALQAERDRAAEELKAFDEVDAANADELAALQSEKEQLENRLVETRQTLEQERQALTEAEEEADALRERLQRAVEERGKLRVENVTMAERMALVEAELVRLQDEATTRLDVNERDQAKKADLEASNERLLTRTAEFERHRVEQQAQAHDLAEELDRTRRTAQRMAEAQQERIHALEAASCVTCDQRQAEVNELEEENARLSSIVNKLRIESADLDSACRRIAMLIAADKLSRLQKANATLRDDKEGLNMALEAKQQELQLTKRDLRRASVALGVEAPSILYSAAARTPSVARSQHVVDTPMPFAMRSLPDESIATGKARRRISFGLPVAPTHPLASKAGPSLYGEGPRQPMRTLDSDTENAPISA